VRARASELRQSLSFFFSILTPTLTLFFAPGLRQVLDKKRSVFSEEIKQIFYLILNKPGTIFYSALRLGGHTMEKPGSLPIVAGLLTARCRS
jgi:hypothetical protein